MLKATGQVFGVLSGAMLVIGGWLWLAGYDLTKPAGAVWAAADVGSLNLLQAVIQRYIYAPMWDAVFVPMLLLPAWQAIGVLFLILAVISALCLYAASRRRRFSFRR